MSDICWVSQFPREPSSQSSFPSALCAVLVQHISDSSTPRLGLMPCDQEDNDVGLRQPAKAQIDFISSNAEKRREVSMTYNTRYAGSDLDLCNRGCIANAELELRCSPIQFGLPASSQ